MIDFVCFSHLRWDFVYQRPQHLMTRAGRTNRVFFVEEPVYGDREDSYNIKKTIENVFVVTMFLKSNNEHDVIERQANLLERLFNEKAIDKYIFWYYTPMMLGISAAFTPMLTIYDCMDELSAFKNADPVLGEKEKQLFSKAQLVFTGGESLYRSKRRHHPDVYCFPSSIDFAHFSQARMDGAEPSDQRNIPHPRLGFFGVLDERFDIVMLQRAAELRPEFHFVMIGPVVKIDPAILPKAHNIHYLGSKDYSQLPTYIRSWDLALILFALNEATRFISPTKTPEYLAAGKPVISTAVTDVVQSYGDNGLVRIVHSAEELVKNADSEFTLTDKTMWLKQVDEVLSENSWDLTWKEMRSIIALELEKQREMKKGLSVLR